MSSKFLRGEEGRRAFLPALRYTVHRWASVSGAGGSPQLPSSSGAQQAGAQKLLLSVASPLCIEHPIHSNIKRRRRENYLKSVNYLWKLSILKKIHQEQRFSEWGSRATSISPELVTGPPLRPHPRPESGTPPGRSNATFPSSLPPSLPRLMNSFEEPGGSSSFLLSQDLQTNGTQSVNVGPG